MIHYTARATPIKADRTTCRTWAEGDYLTDRWAYVTCEACKAARQSEAAQRRRLAKLGRAAVDFMARENERQTDAG